MQGDDEKEIKNLPEGQDTESGDNLVMESGNASEIENLEGHEEESLIEEAPQASEEEKVNTELTSEQKEFTVGYQSVEDFNKQAAEDEAAKQNVESKLNQIKNTLKSSEIFSKVATSSSNKRVQIIFLGAAVLVLGYYIFNMIKEDQEKANPNLKQQQELQDKKEEVLKDAKVVVPPTPITEVKVDVPVTSQKLPELPQIVSPQPPEPPPPPTPTTPSLPIFPTPQAPGSANTGSIPGAPPSLTTSTDNQPFNPLSQGADQSLHSMLSGKDVDEEAKKKLAERRKASSLIMGGGSDKDKTTVGGKDTDKNASDQKDKSKSKNFLGFGDGSFDKVATQKTAAAQISATEVGDLSSMIVQGKVLNAVLETAINTDLPGNLRALITRDVYAENGKAILIPKGSRVVGTYTADLKPGQNRIGVIWSRLIRPDGIDMQIDSEGTDQLGRTGVEGSLDSKFWTQMGLAVMTSYIIPVAAQKLMNVKDNAVVSNTTSASATTGGTPATTSTGTVASQQLQDSTQQFQKLATEAIKNAINVKPTVIIDQGTRVNIYVNKDLIFAKDIALKSTKIVK